MKSKEEFQAYYHQHLAKYANSLEAYRLRNVRLMKRYFLIGLILFPLLTIGIYTQHGVMIYLSLLPSIIFLGMALQKYSQMLSYLRPRFKKRILNKAIAFYFDDYEYKERQKIAKSVLLESKLFPNYIENVHGEDFMRFKIGRARMMFCETAVYKNRDKKVFRGVFLSSSFNKYFKSETFVMKRRKWRLLDRFQIHLGIHLKELKLDNIEFNRTFMALGTDQIESRYILTPSLMSHMLAYSHKIKKKIAFSFVGNRMYCTVKNREDLFEVSLFQPINQAYIVKSLEPVILYTDIIEDLELNLRIWSKK